MQRFVGVRQPVAQDVHAACSVLSKTNVNDGSITVAFKWLERTMWHTHIGNIQEPNHGEYPTINLGLPPHIESDSAEIIQWVAESMWPFSIMKDHRFQSLMKTGQPSCYIPSLETVSHDVKVFLRCQKQILKMLQVSWIIPFKVNGVTENLGTQWSIEFHDWCMDLTKPQGLCRNHHSLQRS